MNEKPIPVSSKNRGQWADILSRCHAGTSLYAAECREIAALLSEATSSDETKDGPSRIDAGLARKLRALSAQFTGETHDLLQMAAIRLESRPPSKAGENHGAG